MSRGVKGRSRAYAVSEPYRPRNSALAVAFNDRCDAVVATAVVAQDRPAAIEPSVIAFLNSETIVHWARGDAGPVEPALCRVFNRSD